MRHIRINAKVGILSNLKLRILHSCAYLSGDRSEVSLISLSALFNLSARQSLLV